VSPDHLDNERLSDLAKRHLWMHMTRMWSYDDADVPIIVSGEGAYIFDAKGRRYLDALAGMLTVQIGHGREELGKAAAKQSATLGYAPIWSQGHVPAIELAARLADLAPGDLNRSFFTTGGGESVETAWKLARQYFKAIGQPSRYKVISRYGAWHGVGLGALSLTGLPSTQIPFEPLVPGGVKVPNTNFYRAPISTEDEVAFGMWAADEIERAIVREGPSSVAAVLLEPIQASGGCITPPPGYWKRVRDICDRHGVLLVSDDVICGFGRLGHAFGAQRYDYLPDMVTMAKGLTSGYAPLGALLCRDFLMEPFLDGKSVFMHGVTFGGHPVSCAVALANLDIMENEGLFAHVLENESAFRQTLERLADLPLVGEVRGAGYFYAIELVKDAATRERLAEDESDRVLATINRKLVEVGVLCRADKRVDPVITLCPPLVCGQDQFDEIEAALREALVAAELEV
jgi:adenosylmethionine-8-amino-7-oxononanoate aminotransferase